MEQGRAGLLGLHERHGKRYPKTYCYNFIVNWQKRHFKGAHNALKPSVNFVTVMVRGGTKKIGEIFDGLGNPLADDNLGLGMTIILYVAGIVLLAGGFLALGFGIPIKDFSLGSTVIQSGVIALGSGVIVVALASVLREMRRLREALEVRGDVRLNPRIPTIGAALPGAVAEAPAREMPPHDQASEAVERDATPPWVQAHRTPRGPVTAPPHGAAPQGAAQQAAAPHPSAPPPRVQTGPANMPPPFSADPPPAPPQAHGGPDDVPSLVEPAPQGEAGHPSVAGEGNDAVPDQEAGRPSLASRFGFPQRRRDNPLPPLQRHPRERNRAAPQLDAPPSAAPAPQPSQPDFDSIWPSAADHPTAAPVPPPAPPRPTAPPTPVSILKSGTVEGMAYTLYSDGSIEADMASGKVRFASIEALRAHLEERGEG